MKCQDRDIMDTGQRFFGYRIIKEEYGVLKSNIASFIRRRDDRS